MNKLTDLIGVKLPIIQAPMAGAQDWALCVAVSKAGGLGSLPCALLTTEQISDQVGSIRAHTNKPFNLNFFCHEMPDLNQDVMKRWQAMFTDDYDRFNIDESRKSSGALRLPFGEETAELLEALKPPVVSFHFGLPTPALLKNVRDSGALIFSSATTLEEAIWLEQQGVDAVIVQGIEAGGHRGMFLSTSLEGQCDTAQLLQRCRDHVKCSLIASGGIGSALDVKNLMDSGADAVQVGTSYLLCDEANTSAVHRQALASDLERETVITNVFSGRPARGLVNGMIQHLGSTNDMAPPFPYAALATNALRAEAEKQGVSDYTPLWSGTNRKGCQKISAATLTKQLAAQVS